MRDSFEAAAPSRRNVLEFGAGLAAGSVLAGCASVASRDARPGSSEAERLAELDERFAALVDHRGSVAPISSAERVTRRARLGKLLSERELDAFLVEPGATMRYLTGMTWGLSERLFALVVLADGTQFWLCPAFEVDRARQRLDVLDGASGDVLGWDEHEHPFKPLAAALRERRATRVGVEPWLRHRFAHELARELGVPALTLAHDVLVELRGRKDSHELALLRRANELTHEALVAVHATLEPGITSGEVRARVRHAQTRLGLTDLWDLTLVGPASAYPHGASGDDKLERGDVLLIDTGGALHDYQSDNTRTWVPFGSPSTEVMRVWNAVRDAQFRAFDAIRPGVRCGELDAIARKSLEAAGFGPGYRYFTHRLGHGIGMEGHEDPYLDGGSDVVLAPGMTFSDEPGVYQLGKFGVRLENIVAVTETGAEVFASWQRDARSPA